MSTTPRHQAGRRERRRHQRAHCGAGQRQVVGKGWASALTAYSASVDAAIAAVATPAIPLDPASRSLTGALLTTP